MSKLIKFKFHLSNVQIKFLSKYDFENGTQTDRITERDTLEELIELGLISRSERLCGIAYLFKGTALYRQFLEQIKPSGIKENKYDSDGILKNMNVGDWIVTKDSRIMKITHDDMNDLRGEDILRFATDNEILSIE